MSSTPSDSIPGDWFADGAFASQRSSAGSQSTQTSVDSQPTILETARPDPVHAALGNSWSSYLSAQHQSREVAILRRATNENFKQVDLAVGSLQRDLASHDALVKASAADFRARSEQIATQMAELKPLQESIPSLQQDLARHKEHALSTASDMNQQFMAMQKSVEDMQTTSSKDLQTVQGQYRSALEKIEFLQGELREMREEKMAAETRLAALERKVSNGIQAPLHQVLPTDQRIFLELIHSRRDDLMKLLDRPATDNLTLDSSQNPAVDTPDQDSQIPLQPEEIEQHTITYQPEPTGTGSRKRKRGPEQEPEQRLIQWKKIAPSQGAKLKSIFYALRRDLEGNPSKSDVTYIWKFLDRIDDPDVSRHIQECLANLLPTLVTMKREARKIRGTTDNHHVTISGGVTWKTFQQVLAEIPPLH